MVPLVVQRPHRQHSVAPNTAAMAVVAFVAMVGHPVGLAVERQRLTRDWDFEIERVAKRKEINDGIDQ